MQRKKITIKKEKKKNPRSKQASKQAGKQAVERQAGGEIELKAKGRRWLGRLVGAENENGSCVGEKEEKKKNS